MDATTVTSPNVRAWEILTGLADYGRSVSSDAQSLVQRIAELAQDHLPCPWGVIAVQAGATTISAGWGINPEWRQRLIERAVPVPAQTIELPLYYCDEPAGMLWLGMPAAHHEQLTPGFLNTLRHQIELLVALWRRQSALAPVAETTNGADGQRYADEIEALRALSIHLGSSLALDELPSAVVRWAQQLVPCATASLSLINPETGLLEPAAIIGAPLRSPTTAASNDQTLGEWSARHRQTIRLSDIRYAPIPSAALTFADGCPISAYMAIPLQVGNQVVGVLELMDPQPDRFSDHQERLIGILAAQAAQAFANAQRYAEDDEHLQIRLLQLRSLQRISRELTSTLYLHNILDFALKEALRATRATQGYVALRGYTVQRKSCAVEHSKGLGVTVSPQTYVALRSVGENGPVRLIVAEGYEPKDHDRLINTPLDDTGTIAAHVIACGEARIVEELTNDDRLAAVGPLPASTLAAPIYYEEQVVGVINLHSSRARAFDRDALDFIRAVADQIALAIGNEERYHEQRRQRDLLAQRATTLNEVLRIGQEMRADRSLDDLLEQIAFGVAETARFRSVAFYLIDNDDSATASLVAAAGLPLAEIERLRRCRLPVSLIEHLLDPQYRIGRSFFVPGQRIRELVDGADLRLLSPLETEGVRASDEWQVDDVLIVPLYRSKSRLVGIMVADEPYDRQLPTSRSVEILEIFAGQAAIAIENAMLLREARSQAEQMASLYRASAAMVSSLDLDSLLERIYDEIAAHVGVPSFCFVASYNPLRDELCFEMFKREGVTVTHLHKRTIPRSGLSGWVIAHGELLYIEDVNEQDRLPVAPVSLGEPVRSWVGIPLMRQNQPIGVLSVQSFEPRAFSARDVQWLSTVANQLAVALSNAQLFAERGQRINELNLINHIGHITSSTLDIEQMFAGVYEALAGFLPIDAFAACVYDAERDQVGQAFIAAAGERVSQRINRAPSAGGLIRRVVDLHQPIRLDDVRDGAVDVCLDLGVTPPANTECAFASCVGVPLVVGERKVVGVLVLQSATPRAYGDRELAFLNTVAVQVALGVQNIRLYTEARDSATALQRKVGELSALLRAAQVLSSSLKPDDVLQSLMAIVADQLQVDTVALWKIDADGFLTPAVMQGISPDMARTLRVPIGKGLTGRVAASGQPLVIANVEEDGTSLYPQFNRDHQYTSFMGVPVVYHEQTIGVLSVMTVPQRVFSADEVALLAGIADQAAIALENARLFAERERRIAELTALNRISQAINVSLSTEEILEALHRGMSEVLDTSYSFIALYDAKTRRLTFPLVYEDGRRAPDRETKVIVLDDLAGGLTPTVILKRRPLLLRTQQEVDAIALQPDDPDKPPICSWLGAPIIQGDEVFGVLNVHSYEPGRFDEDAQRFLMTVANQAAIALSNVRLFQSEQERRRVADTLREVAQMMTGVLALDDIFAMILEQLARIVPYDTASLMLREGDMLRIVAARGFDESIRERVERLQLPVDDDPSLARVVYSRRPLVLVDAREAPPSSADDGTEHIRGWIGAPLLLGDEVIGILNVDSTTVGAYDDEDAQLAFALASQAAQAIRNARLFDEVRRFNAELEQLVSERTLALQEANARLAAERDRLQAVHRITLELTASLDLQTTLNRTLALAAEAVGARRGSIMLQDLQSGQLICRAVLNADGSVEAKHFPITFEKGWGLSGWIMHHREAVCIADVRDDARWLREEGRAEEVRSVIAAPLMTQDGPLGVLILTSPQVNFFGQDQLQLLATIANEVAIVIHNAMLYTIINEIATERGELWSQQREENSKNQAILQSLGEGVIVVDEDQNIVLYNAAAEQILGIPAQFVVKQPLARIAEYCEGERGAERARRIHEGLRQGLQALAETQKNHNRVLELPDPPKSIALNFAPWVGPRNAIYGSVVVLHDITREVEADRMKREFISNVSHELRTPLTSIKGYVDLLMLGAGGPLSEGQISFLNVVKNNTHRLMNLINDILEIGRIDDNKVKLNFESVFIGDIFEEVAKTLRAEIERKRLSFSIEIADHTPPVMADETRLTQVVLNLASNAVKYTYPNGAVKLRAGLNPAGLLQVDVIDNGVGISPEQQQHLFRRFYRADNPLRDEAGGTGLGLSIAKSYVEMHGGQMWVESEVGKGSTFSFIIPLTQPASESESQATDQDRS
ncbi:MAG: GAF domain-containing protein [Roseiflexaceae bacterium]|nr:GAF domain-containing protein [Roseiflexaceae bacterium]